MKQEKLNTILGFILTILSFVMFSIMIRESLDSPSPISIFLLAVSVFLLSRGGIFLFNNLSKWKDAKNSKGVKDE